MKMRGAVACAGLPRMTAERDGVVVPVAAIGIAAVAGLELLEREQPGTDADAAKPDWRRRCRGGRPDNLISGCRVRSTPAGSRGDRSRSGFGSASRLPDHRREP